MEERHGMKGFTQDDVFFTESSTDNVVVIRHLSTEVSRQNADLRQVRSRLAKAAHAANANCIMNFKYGQKKHSWWQLIFTIKWDTESWYGEGDAVQL